MRGDYRRGLAVLVSVGNIEGRSSPIPTARMPLTGTRRWGDDRPTHLHAGVDLLSPTGTPVLAPEDGIIIDVAREARRPYTGYAPCVFMQGVSGRFHLLAHLSGSPIPVSVGQWVHRGDQVGTVGQPEGHTHWEVRIRDHRATDEAAITHSLSPSEWLEGRDVPFILGDGAAPIPGVTSPTSASHPYPVVDRARRAEASHSPSEMGLALGLGVVGGLITWFITRDRK